MKIETYQDEARTTAIYPLEACVVYPALGLIGELAEYCEKRNTLDCDNMDDVKEMSKELSDVLWYCANLSLDLSSSITESLGIDRHACFDEIDCQYCFDSEVLQIAGRCAEAAKKWVRDGFKLDLRTRMLSCVRDTMKFVAQEAADFGFNLSDIAAENIEKLKSRQERGVLKGDGDNR